MTTANAAPDNEYLRAFNRIDRRSVSSYDARWEMVGRFSWAIPDDDALACIARHSPRGVVEIGAGTGYWAHLLRERGVDVVAYDLHPLDTHAPDNIYHTCRESWTDVLRGDTDAASLHPERTLFLCWPPYDEPMAYDALVAYAGDTLVYAGEGPGGCTGDDAFHALLGDYPYCRPGAEDWFDCPTPDTVPQRWREVESVDIPQWYGIYDRLTVYKRIAE